MQVHMAEGFTLIELLITISILAIIGAVTVPTLQERRLMAKEAKVAAVLRSGIHPAMELFRSGGFSDWDADERGEYARDLGYLAGRIAAPPKTFGETPYAFHALPRAYAGGDGTVVVNGYRFTVRLASGCGDAVDCAERYYGVFARPERNEIDGRHAFGMVQDGVVYMSAAAIEADRLWSRTDMRDLSEPGSEGGMFVNNYLAEVGQPNSELVTLAR